MPAFLKIILDYAWGKLVPMLIDWFKKTYKKNEINKEVDSETDELKLLQKEANEFIKNNPGLPLPADLEARLRAAAIKRANGL